MMAKNTRVISFSLDAELVKQIEDLADAKRMNRSKLVEEFIREGMREEQVMVKAAQTPYLMQALLKAFSDPKVIQLMGRVLGQELDPKDLVLFNQGMALMSNYGEEHAKTSSPEQAAANTAKKLASVHKLKKKETKS